MKRSEALKKLSWEHHDALKFARNVAKGLESGAELRAIAEYALYVTDHFLVLHFELEESALVSRLSELQRRNASVQQVLEEHRAFADLRRRIHGAQGDVVRPLLARFNEMLKAHVKLEENYFFPYVERTLDREALRQARSEIDAGHISACIDWAQPFWRGES